MDTSVKDLPLVGEPDTDNYLSTYLNRLRTEAATERSNYTGDHQKCINLYLYGTNQPGKAHVFPKIQGMINSFVDQMARNVPTISLEPVTVTSGGPAVSTAQGEPIILDAEAIGDFYQHAFDTLMEDSHWPRFYRDMCFYGKLLGWQDALVQTDDVDKKLDFLIIPALQWYKDPTQSELDNMAYVGLDWPVDAEWAKRMYPQLSAEIDAAAAKAVYQAPSAEGYSAVFLDQTYARPVVTLSIWWIRNREQNMTDQEGIQTGLLEARQVPMETPDAGILPPPQAPTGDPLQPDAGAAGQSVDDAGDGGSGGVSALPPPNPTRLAMFHTQTQEEVTPDHPLWPRKTVLSETIQIMDRVVSDEVCTSWDIPVASNFNVRIPNRPYGQSDCIRVETLQEDRNDIHASGIKHGRWYRGPTNILPKSAQDEMPAEMRNAGMKPDATYFMDDEMLRRLLEMFKGKIMGQYDPPPLPPAILALGQELDDAFDTAGGNPEVSQGNSPTANSSGELAKTLLGAAQSQNNFTAMYLEEMAWRVAMLALHYLQTQWGVEDFLAINQTFDPQTTALIVATGKTMRFRINVQPAMMKQQKEAQIREDLMSGLIDLETARDMLGYDHKTISMRQQQQQMAAAAVAPSQDPKGSGAASKPGQKPASPGSFKLAQG